MDGVLCRQCIIPTTKKKKLIWETKINLRQRLQIDWQCRIAQKNSSVWEAGGQMKSE
jgi:hypothetical protein